MALGKIDSVDLARYILARGGEMNHLKLQKLLYYVQAWHLAYFDEPLVDDEFEAWMHGPVSRKVWGVFKDGSSPLYNNLRGVPGDQPQALVQGLAPEQVELVNDVLAEYGDKTSYYLECLTHEETPWREARAGVPEDAASDRVISRESIKTYYRGLLEPVNG